MIFDDFTECEEFKEAPILPDQGITDDDVPF